IRIGETLVTNGDFSSYTLLHTYAPLWLINDGWIYLTCQEVSGRYLSLQQMVYGYLDIAEVQAFALKNN
ncbi:hypothetical protein SK128_028625, partial [Halocaridina rubra]